MDLHQVKPTQIKIVNTTVVAIIIKIFSSHFTSNYTHLSRYGLPIYKINNYDCLNRCEY